MIPDTPENVAKAVVKTRSQKRKDWDYLRDEEPPARRSPAS